MHNLLIINSLIKFRNILRYFVRMRILLGENKEQNVSQI